MEKLKWYQPEKTAKWLRRVKKLKEKGLPLTEKRRCFGDFYTISLLKKIKKSRKIYREGRKKKTICFETFLKIGRGGKLIGGLLGKKNFIILVCKLYLALKKNKKNLENISFIFTILKREVFGLIHLNNDWKLKPII